MAEAMPSSGRVCAKGHSIDPNWASCPYCESEQRAKQKTSGFESADASDRQRTRIGPAADASRTTRAMPSQPEQGGYAGSGDMRRITGVLVTYTWWPEGRLFPVREGKNFIGSGDVSSEAFHRSCDVHVPQDQTMSAEHALILCRHGNYEILDQISSNGTFLGGQMLKANQGTELPDRAQIKTGSTLWTFLKIAPQGGEAPPRGTPEAAPKPPTDPTLVR